MPQPEDDATSLLDAWVDAYGRPTAKVMINGMGPFQFMVDTGSTTTVIAARHMTTLGARPLGQVTVVGTTGTASMPLVRLDKLQTGAVTRPDLDVAVLPDTELAREDGILGADVFVGRRLVFDIRNRQVRIEPTKRQVRASALGNMRVRNGLLAEIDGKVGSVSARLMLDTGAQNCIANMALNDALLKYHPTPGARKGLVDTALRTADSGYLTRRLVDVAQELIIREIDCGSNLGLWIDNVGVDTANKRAYLETKLFGRALSQAVTLSDGTVLERNTLIGDIEMAALRDDDSVSRVRVRSVVTCDAELGVCARCYGRSLATGKSIELGEAVGVIAAQSIGEPGTQLTMRTFHTGGVAGKDIAGGLPRVVELFESRTPRGSARLARATGIVRIGDDEGKGIPVTVIDDAGEEHQVVLPTGSRPIVVDGQDVKAGEPITDGPFDPKELMEIKGIRETQTYLVEEVQKVYRDQGVSIHDKHIELIVRQMTRRVGVQEPGDTGFLPGERADAKVFRDTNRRMVEEGKKPAEGRPEIMGITKASLATESWLSAASFQETTRVLTEAAIDGKGDSLLGLKENIIIGKLIPAGTGMMRYRDFTIDAPEYQPMAYFSTDADEDPAAYLANIHGTYSSDAVGEAPADA